MRQFSHNLRPSLLDNLGLWDTIKEHASTQLGVANIELELTVSDDDRHFASQVSILAFRIAQEVVINILKHSDATKLSINMQFDAGRLNLDMRDDGVGVTSMQRSMNPSTTASRVCAKARSLLTIRVRWGPVCDA